MDLRSLRLYLAVLEHGSITKASEAAHVAQPALGLHIRKLEEELGLQLLERHSRGIRVTEAGALLAKHSEVILRYVDLAKEELTNYAKVPSGHFSIGLTPTAREAISVSLVERVSRDLPQDLSGVLVTECTAGGWAHIAGISEGQIIRAIDGHPIDGTQAFEKAVRSVVRKRPRL